MEAKEKIQGDDVKNINKSRMMQDLKSAISEIISYFRRKEPDYYTESYEADYREESHQYDHDNFVYVKSSREVRVKAIVDFQPSNKDELGFVKNDIITIRSMKDEHCWIGEVDGRSGWFPSKFVKVLDERSKKYSQAGDGFVNREIIQLIRTRLMTSLLRILRHGMKQSLHMNVLTALNDNHVWNFIQQVANYEISKDYQSVVSRLLLCKTFRLDEEGKVLTPEELLFRSVEKINNEERSLDEKFSSFLSCALNEQCLHLWWEMLCTCDHVTTRRYDGSSFVASPAWIEIKCELRVLANFTFYLPLAQSPRGVALSNEKKNELRREVDEMLVKHHLFSWHL